MRLPASSAGRCLAVFWRPGWRLFCVLLLALSIGAGCGLHVDVPPARERGQWPEHRPLPHYYTVVQGDTLYAIAFRYRLDYRDLAHWNSIHPPYLISPNERLRLRPQPGQPQRSAGVGGSSRSLPPRQAAGTPRSASQSPPPRRESPPPQREAADRPSPPPAQATPPASDATSADGWRWPVQGQVIRAFGASGAGRRGIDIGGELGDAVRAARGGEVVYSGSGLVGYGELIIIKHDERYLSAYGFNQRRLVEEGERVNAGQVIARMGNGPDNRAMLHFEVRDRGQPINPAQVLP